MRRPRRRAPSRGGRRNPSARTPIPKRAGGQIWATSDGTPSPEHDAVGTLFPTTGAPSTAAGTSSSHEVAMAGPGRCHSYPVQERDVSRATTELRHVMARKNQQGISSPVAAAKERHMRKNKESGMEKEKEKGNEERKEKGRGEKDNRREGRKEQKGRMEAKEGDAVGAGQVFFKVFFPHHSGDRLKIPQPFCKYLKEEPNRPVSLKGPSGNTWQVMLTSVEEGLGFTQGWKEFVGDHSVQQGHFLVFTYDGHSEFSVVVFSNSCVEDKLALDAQPSEVEKVKEGAQGADAAGSTVPDSNKDLSCMLGEYSCYNKSWTRGNGVPRVGKVVSKKFRQPLVISQRRRVTEEEKAHALDRATEFKSKNPFTLQVMIASYVYLGFFMNIPSEFVREYLPQTGKKMTLWDPQGKPWEVQYVCYRERSVAAFSGGWGKFAVGNNLEKFDVCIFELLKEDNIKVHIYRVVPQITPLLCRKSM
ncbi:hypothetical protein EJB05_49163 [Eragrostis curvula]|uniref:TF-B3 domain-containing protein n=1 Tax=Eragrostis curvula TaxID=38414 RepID=A0A5J9T3K9_9POAL|nr:hypothetical protein EJB05_49163 [Eragrostis curvula]